MEIGKYWEKRVVSWDAIVDDDGNVWKLSGEEVENIIENGTEELETSDAWQVMN